MGVRYMTATEARRDLSAVVAEVMRTGITVIVTRRGKPVAKIAPLGEAVGGLAPSRPTPAADPLREEAFAEFERAMEHVLASRQDREEGRAPESDEHRPRQQKR